MLNVTNPVGKDKSRWPKDNLRCPKGNTAETFGVPDLYLATTTWGRCDRPASIADAVRSACTLTTAGRRLFAINDAEARWHDWQVTETRGGLGRRYRDARFAALAADPSLRSDELQRNAAWWEDGDRPLGGEG
jgi:hypothetical protein